MELELDSGGTEAKERQREERRRSDGILLRASGRQPKLGDLDGSPCSMLTTPVKALGHHSAAFDVPALDEKQDTNKDQVMLCSRGELKLRFLS